MIKKYEGDRFSGGQHTGSGGKHAEKGERGFKLGLLRVCGGTTDLEKKGSAGDSCVGEDEKVVEGRTGNRSSMGSIPAGRGGSSWRRRGRLSGRKHKGIRGELVHVRAPESLE